ncbi:hypothetical protein BDW59DRAFT_167385 [Aspergillus cavernicola]|uniref:Uncharacterized protein n=1 Tax=Aspergillus cavernicola TaxID=176166 RepID=A0ABR4HEA8_9EURO
MELTVGQVAGLVALGVFIFQFWIPNSIVAILVGFLKNEHNAATWSVAGKAIQSSSWPSMLQADSVTSRHIPRNVLLLTHLTTASMILVAVTGVVTPLGLFDALEPSGTTVAPFVYARDNSPMGYGTPPRSDVGFNRRCGAWEPVACPGSNTEIISETSDNGTDGFHLPYGYNITIPSELAELYSSGTGGRGTTISNVFDIQWRQYYLQSDPGINNGSRYLIGTYRQLSSMVLNNATDLIEGLIVDTKDARVGLRNHTIPTGLRHGGIWSEDLLFVQPETECVANNLTIDFTVSGLSDDHELFGEDISLTDRGGFANIITEYPDVSLDDNQRDPKLRARAYKAAWMTNSMVMLYLNVTNPAPNAFSYLNSHVGGEFPLMKRRDLIELQALQTGASFNFITPLSTFMSTGTNQTRYENPYDVDDDYFREAESLCQGAGGWDTVNIEGITVACGLMLGAAQRVDNSDSLIFEQNSRWSIPLYTCATAVKATVNSVEFESTGTGLPDVKVQGISEKVYNSSYPPPLWGAEQLQLNLSDVSPLWGLVSPEFETRPNLSTIRQPHLYLPGIPRPYDLLTTVSVDNLPGTGFHGVALARTYDIGSHLNPDVVDYSGLTNIALFARLQELSRTAESAAHIPNLVFTDLVANLIVGTHSVLGSPSDEPDTDTIKRPVITIAKHIKFHHLYGIPAYITLLLWLLLCAAMILFYLTRRLNLARIRYFISRTSAGRTLATVYYPDVSNFDMRAKEWIGSAGDKVVDLTGESTEFARNCNSMRASPSRNNAGTKQDQRKEGSGYVRIDKIV